MTTVYKIGACACKKSAAIVGGGVKLFEIRTIVPGLFVIEGGCLFAKNGQRPRNVLEVYF